MADPLIPFHENGESMFLEEPHRPLIEKLSREQAKEMWLCDPLTQIAWHTADIFR